MINTSTKPKLLKQAAQQRQQQQPQPKAKAESAEYHYIKKLIESKAPVFIEFREGGEICVHLEWADRYSYLAVDSKDREILVPKHSVKMIRPTVNLIWQKGGNDNGRNDL